VAKRKRSKQPSQVPPLDDRHYLAIELLAELKRLSREDIAKACGVSRMTLYRWEQRKDFRREYEKLVQAKLRGMFPRKSAIVKLALKGDIDAVTRILDAADLLA
jgi:AcrR family transcriptional regulator